MEKLSNKQSIIITLDVDAHLFEKLNTITSLDFSLVEINSSDSSILKAAIEGFPNLRIGAANVLTVQQLEDAYQAQVHYVTSPGFLPALAQTAQVYSITYLPGVATFSEAMQAMAVGCEHVRPFPAGLTFCTHLNKYLPKLRLFPAEVKINEIQNFLHIPAVNAVGIVNPSMDELEKLCSTSFVSDWL